MEVDGRWEYIERMARLYRREGRRFPAPQMEDVWHAIQTTKNSIDGTS